MSLQDTPRANRVHIGIFGRTNAGKSSLINALTGQETALVSMVAGTTADPVYKAMEIHGIGPCVFIDTAGFDDTGDLGMLRIEKTRKAVDETDVAILVFDFSGQKNLEVDSEAISFEVEWTAALRERKTPVIAVINKADLLTESEKERAGLLLKQSLKLDAVFVSAQRGEGMSLVREAILRNLPDDFEISSITGHLVSAEDVVLLVMPQDIQAPKGRLILPQVQTIRDLLDNRCLVVSVTAENLEKGLEALKKPPTLIITDSQVFPLVYEKKPAESRLTSFSVLMAGVKGDIQAFTAGADTVDRLTEKSRVLIAEACTHAPLQEDIGRVKLPQMLRKRLGKDLRIDIVSGVDFPDDLSGYDLIVHCGACMFNRKYVLSRIQKAQAQNVPVTNYGILIAKLTGILDHISL